MKGNPDTIASQLLSSTVGSMTSNVTVASMRTATAVTVTITADVVRIIPVGTFTITARASAPIERFDPEPVRS